MRDLCDLKHIGWLDVSAKSGDNVQKAFETIAAELMKVYPKEEQRNEPMAVVEDIRKKRKEFQLQAGQKSAMKNSSKCC